MSGPMIHTWDGKPAAGALSVMATCPTGNISAVQERTRDQLVALAGDRRRGPVEFLTYGAVDGIRRIARTGPKDLSPETLEEARKAIEYLHANPKGRLVIAVCAVEPEAQEPQG